MADDASSAAPVVVGSSGSNGWSTACAMVAVLIVVPVRARGDSLFRVRNDISGLDYRNVCGFEGQWPILEQNGQGVGVIDYDGDGRLDLFVTNGGTKSQWQRRRLPGCRLYRNLGDWRFADVTQQAGVQGNDWSNGVAVADYDADGDFDLYVLNWGPNRLFRNNGDGTFTDVTAPAGVDDAHWSSSAAFADFNGDGRLDLYVSNYVAFDFDNYPTNEKNGDPCLYLGVKTGCGPWCYDGQRDTLYINRGDGTFADESAKSGLECTAGFRGFGVVAADLDGDRDVDVYVGCDVMPNLYLANDGRGHFTSLGDRRGGALSGTGEPESGMGVAGIDFDGNGYLDLLVTNFADQKNTFFRNTNGLLMDDSASVGLDKNKPDMGWGILTRDFDQDGRTDVFIANGHIYPQISKVADSIHFYEQAPRLYLQRRSGMLEELGGKSAFGLKLAANLRGCAAGDLDNDGDLDIVAVRHNGPLLVLENTSNRPAMTIELIDAHGGRSPMGARLSANGAAQTLLPNQGYQSSSDHRLSVPLASNTATLRIKVIWPDGRQQFYEVPAKPAELVTLRQTADRLPAANGD